MKNEHILVLMLMLLPIGTSEDGNITLDEINEMDPIYWFNKGETLLNESINLDQNMQREEAVESYDQSIEAYNRAIELNQSYSDAWNHKGKALRLLGKYNDAIEACNRAIALDPNFSLPWFNKGVSLYYQGKYDEANEAFNETVRLDPNFIEAWSFKGNALDNLGKYDEAVQAYDKVIDLNPQDASGWSKKGRALSELKKYGEAVEAYDEAIKIDPEPDMWYFKGIALKALNRISEAKAAFDNVPFMPIWMEFFTFTRGQGFDALLVLYDKNDSDIACDGKLRVEAYDDREYKKKLWSNTFDVSHVDFTEYTWGLNREALGWKLERISYDEVLQGAEDPTLYFRAYFDSPDGSILRDTDLI